LWSCREKREERERDLDLIFLSFVCAAGVKAKRKYICDELKWGFNQSVNKKRRFGVEITWKVRLHSPLP